MRPRLRRGLSSRHSLPVSEQAKVLWSLLAHLPFREHLSNSWLSQSHFWIFLKMKNSSLNFTCMHLVVQFSAEKVWNNFQVYGIVVWFAPSFVLHPQKFFFRVASRVQISVGWTLSSLFNSERIITRKTRVHVRLFGSCTVNCPSFSLQIEWVQLIKALKAERSREERRGRRTRGRIHRRFGGWQT